MEKLGKEYKNENKTNNFLQIKFQNALFPGF